jgi:hypothetical protein
MAEGPGFEPGFTESESVVLPLNDPPAFCSHAMSMNRGRQLLPPSHHHDFTVGSPEGALIPLTHLLINKKFFSHYVRVPPADAPPHLPSFYRGLPAAHVILNFPVRDLCFF